MDSYLSDEFTQGSAAWGNPAEETTDFQSLL
jgi:hypothetical protein